VVSGERGGIAIGLPILVIVVVAGAACGDEFSLWGNLPKGPYGVGFRSVWQFDVTRAYRMTLDGKRLYGDENKLPRPILINIWYPSASTVAHKRMRHRDYLSVATDEPTLERGRARLPPGSRVSVAPIEIEEGKDSPPRRTAAVFTNRTNRSSLLDRRVLQQSASGPKSCLRRRLQRASSAFRVDSRAAVGVRALLTAALYAV
jgi:hypothetical protein